MLGDERLKEVLSYFALGGVLDVCEGLVPY
jgi:hypothetical protein